MPGTIALDAEVTNISRHCLWVLVDDEELALPFSEFPWFRSATIDQVLNVVRPSGPYLYWPDLDVDPSSLNVAIMQPRTGRCLKRTDLSDLTAFLQPEWRGL